MNFSSPQKRTRYNTKGLSLMIGMAFSVALLSAATLVSSSLLQTQKNVRNIEDNQIAFFSAEAGMEEALYYRSFHKLGFESTNDETASFQHFTKLASTELENTGYKWKIEARCSDSTDAKCKGILPYGKTSVIKFSYDNNAKTTTDSTQEVHPSPLNMQINFTHAFESSDLSTANPNLATVGWIASYMNADGTESKLITNHAAGSPIGNRAEDCMSGSVSNGYYMCRSSVKTAKDTSLVFAFNNSVSGKDELGADHAIINGAGAFFQNNQSWRGIKFLYVNVFDGLDSTYPPLNQMAYTIDPNGETITGTKTIISSTGRSRNIVLDLKTSFDNTEEITALDYSIMFE